MTGRATTPALGGHGDILSHTCAPCLQVMLVVPNSTQSIYKRLWCVAEIKVAKDLNLPIRVASETGSISLMLTDFVSVREAKCSDADDEARIRASIAGEEDSIDRLIRALVLKGGIVDTAALPYV